MSYDVAVYMITGPGPDNRIYSESHNYTSNMAGAWNAAGAPLEDWENKRAGDCVGPLATAIDKLTRCPEDFRHFEPDNGWGNVERMTRFLRKILRLCQEHPDALMHVSR